MSNHERPTIDYASKDYAGFRRLMLDKKRETMPEWTSESPNDFGVVLIEMFAYVGDILSFYQDRIANEAFLSTAANRASVVDIARLLDYRPAGTVAATVDVEITATEAVTVPAGTRISTETALSIETSEPPVIFETDEDLVFASAGTSAVGCTEGRTLTDTGPESTGRIDQSFVLDEFPVIENSVRVFVDEGAGPAEWTRVARLIEATSGQNAFAVIEDAQGAAEVFFGDNVNGRVPAEGASVTAEYRVGVGERGNVGANTLTEMQFESGSVLQEAVDSLTNPSPASGGADQESVTSIRRNVPRVFGAMRRAVSLDDYSRVALQVDGVEKARAEQVAYNTVAVYLAPAGGGTLSASGAEAAEEYINARKMSNITVVTDDPTYIATNITVEINVDDAYVRQQVADRVENAVSSLLDFEEVDFGFLLPVSQVYAAVTEVEGVVFSNVTVLDRDAGTGKDNVQFGEDEIPVVGTVDIIATGGIINT